MDRRIVTARLQDVSPDGLLGRHPAWSMRTALAAIRRRGEVEPGELDAERERAGLLRAQRLKTEFENAVAKGRYVLDSEVERADAIIYTALRDRIRGVASIAPTLVQAGLQGGELALKRRLKEALDAALEEIGSEQLARKAASHERPARLADAGA